MAGRPIFALVSLFFLAAAIILQFFIILSGAVDGSPLNRVFFLQASTQGISGVGFKNIPRIAWTYFALCPITNDVTHNCRSVTAAFPFDPESNFGLTTSGQHQIPQMFIGTNFYFLMSRFAWAFYLMALVFAVLAFFAGLLALCSRIGGFISGATTGLAVFFQALASALMTAWTVKGRNAFNSASSSGAEASLGKFAYGFSWGAFAALFIAMVLFCVSGTAGGKKESSSSAGSRKGFFARNRESTRSRGGVKSEYS